MCRRDLESPLLADRQVTEIAGHWGFDDPAKATSSEEQIITEFRRVRDQIALVFGAYAAGCCLGRD